MADLPTKPRNTRSFADAGLYTDDSANQLGEIDNDAKDAIGTGRQHGERTSDPGNVGTHFGGDGAFDRVLKRRKGPVSAIFIHAGAGYHSTTNERIHLAACSE